MSEYVVGQRWLSSQQPELGLGMIASADNRQVTIYFPLTEEDKLYSAQNNPLIRLVLNPDEEAKDVEGRVFTVLDAIENQGVVLYSVQYQGTSEATTLPETQLSFHTQVNQPEQRLFSLQLDKPSWFDARASVMEQKHNHFTSDRLGLCGARVSLLDYQINIAQQVGNRIAPRVLLADEVGLGKTIEAAMILQKQVLAGHAQRILILVPESLIHQWLVELLRRVNMVFSVFDEERFAALKEQDINPFDSEQFILCSVESMLASNEAQTALLASQFDVLVVDEAHHLHWSETEVSADYALVESLAKIIPGVILLTATPDQLGHESHFARLRLLDPARFTDFVTYQSEQTQYHALAELTEMILQDMEQHVAGKDVLSTATNALIKQQYPDIVFTNSPECDAMALIYELIDHHGTGRMFYRNTRQAVAHDSQREVHTYPLATPKTYEIYTQTMLETAEEACFMHELPDFLDTWTTIDPRCEWLLAHIAEHTDKTLLICRSARTVLQLAEYIKEQTGLHIPVFHEKMSLVERDRAAHFFADPEEGANLLLCSEIGSEGRNFQFCRHLILFDLPMQPDLLEQRIGRLDRIGQTQTIQIHVPYLSGSAPHTLLDFYHEGLNALSYTCAVGSKVFAQFATEINNNLLAGSGTNEALLGQIGALTAQFNEERQSGRDKLLEISSSGKGLVEDLVEDLSNPVFERELEDFTHLLFEAMGIHQEINDAHSFIIKPTEDLAHAIHGLPDDGLTVTYRRDIATAREELTYLSWDHPLIIELIHTIEDESTGKASVAFMADKSIPVGAFYLETLYKVQADHHGMDNNPFLAATPIRLLVNFKGELLSADDLPEMSKVSPKIARKLLPALQGHIEKALAKSAEFAQKRADVVIADSQYLVYEKLGNEVTRLQRLQAINPSISDVEVTTLQTQLDQTMQAVSQAQLHLDSIRLIVNNP